MSKLSTHSFTFAILFLVFSGCKKSEQPPSCLMTSYDYSYAEIDLHTFDNHQFKDGLVDVATSRFSCYNSTILLFVADPHNNLNI